MVNRLDGVAETIDESGQAVLGSLGSRIGEIRRSSTREGARPRDEPRRTAASAIGREVAAISETTLRNLEERSNAVIDACRTAAVRDRMLLTRSRSARWS